MKRESLEKERVLSLPTLHEVPGGGSGQLDGGETEGAVGEFFCELSFHMVPLITEPPDTMVRGGLPTGVTQPRKGLLEMSGPRRGCKC